MFFCTSGSSEKFSGCGPHPTLLIHPAGRTICRAILSVALTPAASITPSTPRPSPSFTHSVSPSQSPRNHIALRCPTARDRVEPDNSYFRPLQFRHRRTEQTDRPRPEHDDAISRLNPRVLDDRAIRHATRFGRVPPSPFPVPPVRDAESCSARGRTSSMAPLIAAP